MPVISVIIPTRNRATYVQQAIESVLASCNEFVQVEIIVVDDGSTDQTLAIVQSYPVKCISGAGKGAAAARNVGIHASTGDLITFLDDDDVWPANNMVQQLTFLEKNPQYGAVCSQVLLTNNELDQRTGPYPAQPFASGWMYHDFLSYIPQVGSLLVRRRVVQAVGDFNELLQGGEDWEWALRIARYCEIGFVPQVVLLWRMHGTTRVDGAGNKRAEDIVWRRYTDVMQVAREHITSATEKSWATRQRIVLRHKGHYIPLFMNLGAQHAQSKHWQRALHCYWLALRVSPPHVASHLARNVLNAMRQRRAA